MARARFVCTLALIELSIGGIIGLLGWVDGWKTAADYANGMLIAGVVLVGFAVAAMRARVGGVDKVDARWRLLGGQEQRDRHRQLDPYNQSVIVTIQQWLGLCGVLTIILGGLIYFLG